MSKTGNPKLATYAARERGMNRIAERSGKSPEVVREQMNTDDQQQAIESKQMDRLAANEQARSRNQQVRKMDHLAAREQARFTPTKNNLQEEEAVPEFVPQLPKVPMGRAGMERAFRMGRGYRKSRGPEIPPGIYFGPGNANRVPDSGSPEYQQLLQRVRDRSLGR